MKRLAILLSGRGSNFEAIADSIQEGHLPARIELVVSNVASAAGLEKARWRGLKTVVIASSGVAREDYDRRLVEVLRRHRVDLVCLAGFMRILSPLFLKEFPNRILNIHPSLLPAFPGLHPQRQALESGVRFSGCTVHFVDEGVDTGPILLQAWCLSWKATTKTPCPGGSWRKSTSFIPKRSEWWSGVKFAWKVAEWFGSRDYLTGTSVVILSKRSALSLTVDEQLTFLQEGVAELIRPEELRAKLAHSAETGKPLRIKAGFDPTAPDLHLGHTVMLHRMRRFQDLGHTVIFLIGDFTGLIGDPSGRSATRKPLSREEVAQNAETYKQQVFKILDPEKTTIDFNSRWMTSFTSEQFLELASRYTVARILERDDFSKRLKKRQPISIHELVYPLIQGYDSVVLGADVEMGGTDQKFNLLVGRELQREYGQEPQVLLMLPLLEGLDGVQKMSKSLGNYIGIQEPASEIFGKVMSISDALMYRYYELCTDLSLSEVIRMRKAVDEGRLHPKAVKVDLAKRIVRDFHSLEAANKAEEAFNRIHSQRLLPDQMEEKRLPVSQDKVRLSKLIVRVGLASSVGQAVRLIIQDAVTLNHQKVTDVKAEIDCSRPSSSILKVGKRGFVKVIVQ